MAFDFGILSGVGSILGGLGGLFGKKKAPTPAQNIMSQAQGARQAADAYGFNPLTLLQYGQPGGAMASGGGAPPLASIDLITGGLKDINDVVSGDAARRRQADQLQVDLRQLQLEQLRSGVVAVAPSYASGVGDGPSPLGRRAATVGVTAGNKAAPFGMAPNPLDPRREKKTSPVENTAGVIEIDQPWMGDPVTIPGADGEPWGIDELATAVVVGAPQLAGRNYASGMFPLGRVSTPDLEMRMIREKKSRAEDARDLAETDRILRGLAASKKPTPGMRRSNR